MHKKAMAWLLVSALSFASAGALAVLHPSFGRVSVPVSGIQYDATSDALNSTTSLVTNLIVAMIPLLIIVAIFGLIIGLFVGQHSVFNKLKME